jgi:hypothetical protein
MLSTFKALAHALCYYLEIKARRVDLDMLLEIMEREDSMQRQLFNMSAQGEHPDVITLHTAKLRELSRTRVAIGRRLAEGGVDDSRQTNSEGVAGDV